MLKTPTFFFGVYRLDFENPLPPQNFAFSEC